MIQNLAASLPVFMLAIVCHEYAHAWMAKRFGDTTAEREGRLTLNPVVHADPIGTLVFPMIGILAGGVMFGWAKPVPVDARYFKNFKSGVFWVAFAGPLANIILSIISAILLALFVTQVDQSFSLFDPILHMLRQSAIINIILAVFNLIPFPPLDGSKMVSTFLNYDQAVKYEQLSRFSFVFILLLWFTNVFSYLVTPAIWMHQKFLGLLLQIMG